ncbi:hypothetical protein C8J56DRAFT_879757 [Mycena floridula]|nr:hypothetical protein C8J56DRAFT_879757 [Mycena floridula]
MAPSSTNNLSSPSEPPANPESPSVTLSPVVSTPFNLNPEKTASAKFAEQLAPTVTSGKGKQPLAPLRHPPKSAAGSNASSLKSNITPKSNTQGNNVPAKAKISSQSNLKKPEAHVGNSKQALSPMSLGLGFLVNRQRYIQAHQVMELSMVESIAPISNQHAEDPLYARGDTEEVKSLIQDHSVLSYHLNDADAPVYQLGGPLYYPPIFLGIRKHIKVMPKCYDSWMQVLGVEDPLKFIEYPAGPPEKTRGYFSAEMLLKMWEILTRVYVQPRDGSVIKEEHMVVISVNKEVQY